jgi:solute carrier family 25 uncoupling protein 8/9
VQVKQAFVGKDHKGDVPLHLKIASGLTTGAIAITVASPTDLVKVRPTSRQA